MDITGLANGGVLVPIIACLAMIVAMLVVVRVIRRSAARMAEQNREWIEQLPASTAQQDAVGERHKRHLAR